MKSGMQPKLQIRSTKSETYHFRQVKGRHGKRCQDPMVSRVPRVFHVKWVCLGVAMTRPGQGVRLHVQANTLPERHHAAGGGPMLMCSSGRSDEHIPPSVHLFEQHATDRAAYGTARKAAQARPQSAALFSRREPPRLRRRSRGCGARDSRGTRGIVPCRRKKYPDISCTQSRSGGRGGSRTGPTGAGIHPVNLSRNARKNLWRA